MTCTATLPASTTVDVRALAPRDRHPMIFSHFRGLDVGQSMELVTDHDPKPVFYQLQADMPSRFSWDYLETGPADWRVRITKLAAPTAEGRQCCGASGGG